MLEAPLFVSVFVEGLLLGASPLEKCSNHSQKRFLLSENAYTLHRSISKHACRWQVIFYHSGGRVLSLCMTGWIQTSLVVNLTKFIV